MFVNSTRLQRQFEYLASIGIDTAPLYKQIGLPEAKPFNVNETFGFEPYRMVLDFALKMTGNPDYGLDFGNQPYLGGTVGMMCASCANLKEAFIQGCKFFKVQGDIADLSFVDDKSHPKLVYTLMESWYMESPHTAKLEVDAMFSFLNTIVKINSNNILQPRQIKLAVARPDRVDKYTAVFGTEPRFDAGVNEMVFHHTDLLIPMKAFNKETFELLNSHLQSQLERIGKNETITDQVKRILHTSFKYQFPDIYIVAEKLNLSTRTLQRKLSDEQTSFKDVLQEARFGIARKLLRKNSLTVSEISYTLGYSDLGNFSRSFKKYTGMSPQEFRSNPN